MRGFIMSDGINHSRGKQTHFYAMSSVQPGNLYRHFKGNEYVVLAKTIDSGYVKDKEKQQVTYLCTNTGKVYHRSLEEFISPKVYDQGIEQIRFKYIGRCIVTINKDGNYEITKTL